MIDYNCVLGTLKDMTLRGIFRNNLQGKGLRVRFSNLYSPHEMHIEKAEVRILDEIAGEVKGPGALTLGGEGQIRIPAGRQVYSDPVDLEVAPGDVIEISFYFKEVTKVRAVCMNSSGKVWYTELGDGDQIGKEHLTLNDRNALFPVLGEDPNQNYALTGIADIEILTDRDPRTLLLFGDSITHMSYVSDPLTLLLYRSRPGEISVINRGISGNRFSRDYPNDPTLAGNGKFLGIAGKNRFDRDVFQDGCPDYVFLMEGVNDVAASFIFKEAAVPTGEEIWKDMEEVIQKVHDHGAKIYLATVAPFGFPDADWKPEAEQIRAELNACIRTQNLADGIIDFDALMRDEKSPHFLKGNLHLGDWIHPNTRGGRMMARAIWDKGWFS